MKFLPPEAPCKTETKQPFEEQKENPSRLQRYVDESLAFQFLEILYPLIMVSQEKMMGKKSRQKQILLGARGHVHIVQHHTWQRSLV